MEIKEWMMIGGLAVNIFAVLLIVGRARLSIEHRITSLETTVHLITNPPARPEYIHSTPVEQPKDYRGRVST